MRINRRALLAGAGAVLAAGRAAAAGTLRLGLVQYGSVQWVAETMRRHGLDAAHGFALSTVTLASTDGARIAILGGEADVVTADWTFVAGARAQGHDLQFVGQSAALGGVMVRDASPIRSVADLRGAKLGVAGGKADKSWLILQAAARRAGLDLGREASVDFAAPPLLSAKLLSGELDAVLTYWTFCARLEAAGAREAVSVDQAAAAIGITAAPVLVGYAFSQAWADRNQATLAGFLQASNEAEARLARDPAEWAPLKGIMGAPDEKVFASLRRRFLEGRRHPDAATQTAEAGRLMAALAAAGVLPADRLPTGLFRSVGV